MEELVGIPENMTERIQLESRLKSGANWFYWIAGLSIINSVIWLTGGEWAFIFGLGITQVIDAITGEIAAGSGVGTARYIGFALDLLAAGGMALFGFLAGRAMLWAFLIGIFLYILDGLLFVLVQDWLGVGFHVFALVGMFAGLQACRQLRRMDRQPATAQSEDGIIRVEFR